MKRKLSAISLQISALVLCVFWWIWSFTQTDPNLYYSSNSVWVRFQQFMWQTPRPLVVGWYVVMICIAFGLYLSATTKKVSKSFLLLALCFVLLAISNNALSHDIYNYMFNAKAVALYSQDPHLRSALEIAPQDEWVRFMHNVHTTAPYGHVWTYFSLVPFFAGMGKFVTTYLSFKVFMAMGLGLLAFVQSNMVKERSRILLFLLNPLVLIETLSSGHNDVWMMVFALGSFAMLAHVKKMFSLQTLASLGLLLVSTQIKEATIVLIPLWGCMAVSLIWPRLAGHNAVSNLLVKVKMYWAEIAVILLFIPLFTARSQQFNPWYLIWPLTFLPFLRSKTLQIGLVVFSLTSLLRYVPLLFVGGYSEAVQLQMRVITWSAIAITCGWLILTRIQRKHV